MSTPPSCPVCELHAEAVFRVEGMDCNEEVAILERRLKPLKGLEAMSAAVVGGTLRVSHDAAQRSAAAIAEAVNGTGMRAWLDHDSASSISVRSGAREAFLVASGSRRPRASGWAGSPPRPSARVCSLPCRWRRAAGRQRLIGAPVRPDITLMLIAVAGAITQRSKRPR
jgi:copper chaperone CopZ